MKKNNFILLLFGKNTNRFGDSIFDYINQIIIASAGPKYSFLMSLYQSSSIIISIFFTMLGGLWADFKDRKKILFITDILAGILVLFLGFFFKNNNITLLIVINIILSIFHSFSTPTYKSIVKNLISKQNINSYNSISNGISEMIGMIAPVITNLIIFYFNYRVGFFVNSLTFFISAMCVYNVEYITHTPTKKSITINYIIKNIQDTLKYVIKSQNLRLLVIMSATINFFLAGYNLMLPYLNTLTSNSKMFTYILITEAIGSFLGTVISYIYFREIEIKKLKKIFLFIGMSNLLIYTSSILNNILVVLSCILLFSILLTLYNIANLSLIQQQVSSDHMGRVFSTITTLSILLMPIGSLFFSIVGVNSWKIFFIVGLGIIMSYFIFLGGEK